MKSKPDIMKTLYASTAHVPQSSVRLMEEQLDSGQCLSYQRGWEITEGPGRCGFLLQYGLSGIPGLQDCLNLASDLGNLDITPFLQWAFQDLKVDYVWLSSVGTVYPEFKVFSWD